MVNLRYTAMTLFFIIAMVVMIAGRYWSWAAFLYAISVMTLGDEVIGSSRKLWTNFSPRFLNFLLFATLPLLAALSMIVATFVSTGDPFGIIYLMRASAGLDIAAIRAATTWFDMAGAILLLGLLHGAAGINVAHELFHRVDSPRAVTTGRWLLAFSWDTTFAIEHVHGHHIHVATEHDPASASRGQYIGHFIAHSTVHQIIKAFQFETKRLKRKALAPWSWHNRALRGQMMSLVIAGAYFYAAGWAGVGVHICLAIVGKSFLESVNYIEHYGLVRVPGEKVAPRHSWDCYRIVSNALLYNLPRHSAHHQNAAKRFWELEANRNSPLMPYGYMTMIIIAFIPPIWRRKIDPLLKQWDSHFASPSERQLISARGW